MSEHANVNLIHKVYEDFGSGNIAAVLEYLDPQAELHFEGPESVPWAGTWEGHEGWSEFFQTLGETADQIVLQMQPFAVQGDKVVTAGRYQARVKSTGKRINSPLVHLWTIRDGRVLRCQEMTNTAAEVTACTA